MTFESMPCSISVQNVTGRMLFNCLVLWVKSTAFCRYGTPTELLAERLKLDTSVTLHIPAGASRLQQVSEYYDARSSWPESGRRRRSHSENCWLRINSVFFTGLALSVTRIIKACCKSTTLSSTGQLLYFSASQRRSANTEQSPKHLRTKSSSLRVASANAWIRLTWSLASATSRPAS